ncbi:MAG: alpha-1,2-fucosyltransferase [Chitinophagaceae bacterium]|nr:MAG: alpha-1,2-fucosyltransferase [Chitinophagaceae bacterium]
MIIVRLIGGLGNQMFQYAFGKALSMRHGTELKLDLSGYTGAADPSITPRQYALDIFSITPVMATRREVVRLQRRIPIRIADAVLTRVLGPKKSYVIDDYTRFSASAAQSPDNVLLQGYWQSPLYFDHIEAELRQEFTFRESPSPAISLLLREIRDNNSICVHVRRGDFLTNPVHGFLGEDYYRKAAAQIRAMVPDPKFYVFSDDIEWCRANMDFLGNSTFVGPEFAGRKDQDHLRLMAACRNFIIANSSFAWWATWLNQDDGKTIIAPSVWTNSPAGYEHIYRKNWIVINKTNT